MNYGHQAIDNTAHSESDLIFLKGQGITNIRIAFPGYANSASIANCQDMVLRALAHGFYVIWGVSTGVGNGLCTATIWAAYKTYVTGTLAAWAQSNSVSELSVGNECDIQCDGTTLTMATVRSDARSMCVTVKSGGYTGLVSYQTSAIGVYRDPWHTEGIGTLDRIGFNNYDTLSNFDSRNHAIVGYFGSQTYISEWGCVTNGWSDYNDENLWYTDFLARLSSLQSQAVQTAYFFCYRDGGFGLGADTFALALSTGSARCIRGAMLNTPGQKVYGGF